MDKKLRLCDGAKWLWASELLEHFFIGLNLAKMVIVNT